MDIENRNEILICSKHGEEIVFLEIDLVQGNDRGNIFLCQECVNEVKPLRIEKYVQIKQIIEYDGDIQVNSKCQSFNANSIYSRLADGLKGLNSQQIAFKQLKDYFDELKRVIIDKVDECAERMMIQALSVSKQQQQSLEQQQRLASHRYIQEIRQQLVDKSMDIQSKEAYCRQLIVRQQQQIKSSISSLQDQFNSNLTLPSHITFQQSNNTKEQILSLLQQINVFPDENGSQKEVQSNQSNGDIHDLNSDKLIELLQAGSKCSDQFLASLKHLFQKAKPLFSQISFQDAFQNQKDILSQLNIIKTNFLKSEKNLKIQKNGMNDEIEISVVKKGDTNCVSNLILDRNERYVFRFSLEHKNIQNLQYCIGLMRDSQKDTSYGTADLLSFKVWYDSENHTFYKGGRGIDKPIKGDLYNQIENINEIEMRVCLKDQILEITDYPNYNHILSIQDHLKNTLAQKENLRLYLCPYLPTATVIIKRAFICNQFSY